VNTSLLDSKINEAQKNKSSIENKAGMIFLFVKDMEY